jgi:hypothetical protein
MDLRADWLDVNDLLKASAKLAKLHGSRAEEVRKINIKAATKGVAAYRSAVHQGDTVRVRRSGPSSPRYEGGKRGPSQNIMPGTLRRSIKVIKPKNGTNVWLGPKSSATFVKRGLSQVNRSDSWFSDIVNQGRNRFGPGKNRGFASRGMARARKKILPELIRMHANFIEKHF